MDKIGVHCLVQKCENYKNANGQSNVKRIHHEIVPTIPTLNQIMTMTLNWMTPQHPFSREGDPMMWFNMMMKVLI